MGTFPALVNFVFSLFNSYFSPDTKYLDDYSFISEPDCAVPANEDLYDDIMSMAVSSWGMVV